MALYDNPPHSCTIYASRNGTDSAGGSATTYTLRQASVPCSIDVASSSTRLLYAQQGVEVNATIAFLSSALTAPVERGDKIVGSDGRSYHVEGIRNVGLPYGNIPSLSYIDCRALA